VCVRAEIIGQAGRGHDTCCNSVCVCCVCFCVCVCGCGCVCVCVCAVRIVFPVSQSLIAQHSWRKHLLCSHTFTVCAVPTSIFYRVCVCVCVRVCVCVSQQGTLACKDNGRLLMQRDHSTHQSKEGMHCSTLIPTRLFSFLSVVEEKHGTWYQMRALSFINGYMESDFLLPAFLLSFFLFCYFYPVFVLILVCPLLLSGAGKQNRSAGRANALCLH